MSKKGEVQDDAVFLGRPGNNLKAGIVGLPNVGKSSLFNVMCSMTVPAENFPFCTIDPSSARVGVPDERFDYLTKMYEPARSVSAFLWVTDIAGLVKGAADGQGLGNAFLSHIRAVDGILHLIRIFSDEEVIHVEGEIDPVRDLDIISRELRLKDIEWADKALAQVESSITKCRADKVKMKQFDAEKEVLSKVKAGLEEGKDVRDLEWTAKDIDFLNELEMLTAKPITYLLNMSEEDFIRKKNKWLPKIKAWVDAHGGAKIIPLSVKFEEKIAAMTPEDRVAYCKEHNVDTALPKVIKVTYDSLRLIHYFTAGKDEVKCWTIKKGTKAPQAAGVIHTDFEHGFIMAEVFSYDDFKERGSEGAVKAAGKYRMEGKNYVVQDGDIMFFKFNAPSAPAKKK